MIKVKGLESIDFATVSQLAHYHYRHKRMTVKALPGSSLEVVETKFFFHLLVSLLANPTRLDGGC